MARLRTGNNTWNARMTEHGLYTPNTVKGMTRKDLQLDQLRRHSTRIYLVTEFISVTGLTM